MRRAASGIALGAVSRPAGTAVMVQGRTSSLAVAAVRGAASGGLRAADIRSFSGPAPSAPMPLGTADPLVFDLSLNNLRDNIGSRQQRIRVGRGHGGRRGGKCGRGMKGQKARSGGAKNKAAFEGGQTPHFRQHRKYGFRNDMFAIRYDEINLARIQQLVNDGRLPVPADGAPITLKTLRDLNIIKNPKHGVKLLARGADNFKAPLNFEIQAATPAAKKAIEAAGGSVKTVYHGRVSLRAELHPEKFEFPIQRPVAPRSIRDRFDEWGQEYATEAERKAAAAAKEGGGAPAWVSLKESWAASRS